MALFTQIAGICVILIGIVGIVLALLWFLIVPISGHVCSSVIGPAAVGFTPTTVLRAACVGVVSVALLALLVILGLCVYGLTGTGPRKGSSAARLQARTGNVRPGSRFATAQSIAMRRVVRIVALLGGIVVLGVVARLLGHL